MRILKATLTVARPDAAVAFYRDVLELPVAVHDGGTVGIGFSSLVLEQGDDFEGVHYPAFGIRARGLRARTYPAEIARRAEHG